MIKYSVVSNEIEVVFNLEELETPIGTYQVNNDLVLIRAKSATNKSTAVLRVPYNSNRAIAIDEAEIHLQRFISSYILTNNIIPKIDSGYSSKVIPKGSKIPFEGTYFITLKATINHPPDQITTLLKRASDLFDQIETIPKEKRYDFVRHAFRFYYSGSINHQPEGLVDLITSLEALLSNSNDEISHKLASRSATLISRNEDERLQLFKDIKKFYGTRSNYVHGNISDIPYEEKTGVQKLASRALILSLHLARKGMGKDEIISLIDSSMLSDKSRKHLYELLS